MNKWIINAILVLGVVIAAGAGLYLGLGMREKLNPIEFRYQESTPNALLGTGEEFPDVPVMDADSAVHATSGLLADGGVVIFMELGCPPCSVMSASWGETLAKWSDHPPVLGITDAPVDRIARYREELGIVFPIYCDTGKTFATAYQVIDFPLQLVVDNTGLIRAQIYDSRQIIDTATITALILADTAAQQKL